VVADRDTFFMRKALQLAERGRATTSPNPMVGALVVTADGVIVGRGAHEFAGGPHAEVHALGNAGTAASGATLYCTLEPCSHAGRTPPCAPLVATSGVRRVVVATEDPNPMVGGRGLALLRSRGIDVTSGVLAHDAARLNAPFFTAMRRQRPFVTMKVALSHDGRVASAAGERTALTGSAANRRIHRDRAEIDAIAIGSGTMLSDDPLLTARGAYRARPLVRVIYDSRLRTSPSAMVFATLGMGPVIIVGSEQAPAEKKERLLAAGAELELLPERDRLAASLQRLAARGVRSLMVEGGPTLHQAFWDRGVVDSVQMYITPHVLGESGVPWRLHPSLLNGSALHERSVRLFGDDVLIEGYVHRAD
jgi:diaminohydroxyphosphoribosylaminopyrimidine deaminase / 5-amino-6-(5-phosphoribosylamino)uracil reductase